MEPSPDQPSAPPPAGPCWSNIVKQQPQSPSPSQQQSQKQQNIANQVLQLDSCKSAHGVSMAVIDANAVIQGGEKLHNLADKFVTVAEVMAEIRDPVSRHRLSLIPFSIESVEPTPESLNKVIKFARATGDLQTLSDVDLKLIALTYTLEAQLHGTQHLRDVPPPIHTINVKRLPEKDLPGWGSNVPNLEEWEALEQEAGDGSDKLNSKILPLKDIDLNIIQQDNEAENGSVGTGEEGNSESHDIEQCSRGSRRYPPKKTVVNLEGKTVADGVDASQGQHDDDDADWMPAVSRSTHRRFLKRKGRREQYTALAEKDIQEDLEKSVDNNNINESIVSDQAMDHTSGAADAGNEMSEGNEMAEVTNDSEDLSSILEHMRLEEGSLNSLQEGEEESIISTEIEISESRAMEASSDYNADSVAEDVVTDSATAELDHLEVSSQTHESVDASYTDDIDSEHSLMLRSLSESSVACVTSDFAMQNVLLQMGLRLLAPGGNQIRQLHRWVLKCHACFTVTAEIGRIFCPKCGNGGTLRKVAVTVGENGITVAARRPRITLRGTKFSLPTPQGGRNAISKNLILREDQLPQKFLYPKNKKKSNKEGDDFVPGDIFSFTNHTDKKAPYRAPVRQALAVFSGKRNPNDNHYSRSKH